jgi:hypothetical protein
MIGKKFLRRSSTAAVCIGGLVMAAIPHFAAAEITPKQQADLARYFGFGAIETIPLDHGISKLCVGDFDRDGRNDIAVANNRMSKIEILLQRKEPLADDQMSTALSHVNDLPESRHYRRDSIPVVWRVSAMAAADVTGDQRLDLVIFGDPRELIVLAGKKDGGWESPRVYPAAEGVQRVNGLACGDFNHDERTDVALLAEEHVLIFHQDENGRLARPVRYAHAGQQPHGVFADDLNGDGRCDMMLFSSAPTYPLAVRLQNQRGTLGPLEQIKMASLRWAGVGRFAGESRADVIGIEQVSGRIIRSRLGGESADAATAGWRMLLYAYPLKGSAKSRPITVADVDGDGRSDVVAADPDTAQLIWFRNVAGLGLDQGEIYPGLIKTRSLSSVDLNGDGRDEIVMVSEAEKSIGISGFREGRITFPSAVKVEGTPVVATAGPLRSDAGMDLAYVSKKSRSKYEFVLQPLTVGDSEFATGEPAQRFDLPKINGLPSQMRTADVNQDGRTDLLVFVPYEPLMTFVQDEKGEFSLLKEQQGGSEGLVKNADPAGFFLADVTADGKKEVLLARAGFARAMRVDTSSGWSVVDQYNAPAAASRVTGIVALAEEGADYPRLAAYDKTSGELHVLRRGDQGKYEIQHSIPVGAFDLNHAGAAALSGDDSPTILLADASKFAVVLPDTPPLAMEQVGRFETKIKDARLSAVAAGDLNGDGITDLAAIESGQHHIEVLTLGPSDQIIHATQFKIFETRGYRGESNLPEPRQAVIADVTADGKQDLLLVVHDRVLIYPSQ